MLIYFLATSKSFTFIAMTITIALLHNYDANELKLRTLFIVSIELENLN